jgi:hypothetical protein
LSSFIRVIDDDPDVAPLFRSNSGEIYRRNATMGFANSAGGSAHRA